MGADDNCPTPFPGTCCTSFFIYYHTALEFIWKNVKSSSHRSGRKVDVSLHTF
ncbi:hypothetical protein L873DRAFT_1801806 [Choiromyces venosus 120613-1]|uniref:Uncharacterized protein n=1 Tax=Choiromyces venosus 120613-1 TaxID=1336337 RepID=A0A3N4JWQ3_9PEZI|nr:hypothetical protein L873DRAFT_1801806 [Choiromyces venosus 120613-1]